jgi:voltage-gated potassium channel
LSQNQSNNHKDTLSNLDNKIEKKKKKTSLRDLLDWKPYTKPEYDIQKDIYGHLKAFRLPLVLVQLVMLLGTLGYMWIDDFTIIDAIYQTGITFTTVGFGEIAPISSAGRMFTITLIIFGFAVFTLAAGLLIDAIVKGKLLDLYKEKGMLYKIARLQNHFVIFYHNEYTVQLAKQFRESHIPFVVVDPDPDFEKTALECKYPYYLIEEPFTEKAFLKSHLSSAKGAISLSKNIANNITLISSLRLYEKDIKRDNKPFLIITNAESPKDVDRLERLGADKVVAAPSLMAKRMSAIAIKPEFESLLETYLYKKDAPIAMEKIRVNDYSWMVGHKLKDAHLRDYLNVSVVGIELANGRFVAVPKGDKIITADSDLIVVGSQRGISKAKYVIDRDKKPQMSKENTQPVKNTIDAFISDKVERRVDDKRIEKVDGDIDFF